MSCAFPRDLRKTDASFRLNNFIIGLITPPLVQNTGFGAYVFFAVFCGLSFAWTYFFVPETTGRSLEQMDAVFKDFRSEAELARRLEIERSIAQPASPTVEAAVGDDKSDGAKEV